MPRGRLDDRELQVDDVDILQVLYEIRVADRESLVPPALNPTIPPVISFLAYRAKESAFGPFSLVQLRLTARSGVRPRAFLVSARCDNPALAEVLASSWGFRSDPGEIALRRFHDRVDCTVRRGRWPDPPGVAGRPGADHGARRPVPAGHAPGPGRPGTACGRASCRCDTEYEFRRADRGRPELDASIPRPGATTGSCPTSPVSASFAACD